MLTPLIIAFGPSTDAWTTAGNPRPFGDACVDGFDFDIESELSVVPTVNGTAITDYKTRGYATMITQLKDTCFAQDSANSYYISGSPQCVLPDEHFSSVIDVAWFDFLFVQFYNTASCSARAGISYMAGNGTDDISYSAWTQAASLNTDVMIYLGLAASETAASNASFYLTPGEVKALVGRFSASASFGGIMLWEATYSQNNTICQEDYATWMKSILNAAVAGTDLDTDTSTCGATTTSSSSTSSPASATPTVISPNGLCGGSTGYICQGSEFGDCCSEYGYWLVSRLNFVKGA